MGKVNEGELKELFIEIKHNNKIALEKLYNRYNKLVYGIAFSILKNKEDSEDVVQTVFSKLYILEKDKLPTDKIGTWLYTVTKNEALLLLRKDNNDVGLDTIYDLEDENNEIDKFINKDSYNRLINGLNQKEQEVISLKILSNFTFKEIGELLGESANTIKWRYYKSIYSLRIMLGNLGMFIITFVLGIATLKNQERSAPIDKADQDTNNSQITNGAEHKENQSANNTPIKSDTEHKENEEFRENDIIQDNESTNNVENVIIEDTNINTTNYLSIGIFSISTIFLALTIFFSIFLAKHQLKTKKKASK
jgi:RNA polymerase sigma factor (sigma-70 family)